MENPNRSLRDKYRKHQYSGPKKCRRRKTAKKYLVMFGKTISLQRFSNGEQEKAIAVEKNNVNANGIPHITVYVDGGWPKRSYGHDYSSPSGMACIIGKETKKCLYIGIKNKYCYHCHIYEKDLKPVPAHTCFKNYDGPSTGMEAAILVEGFQRSEEMHGIQYLNFIGDGDSSLFAQLREKVSYGREIKKTECKNHVIKNYTSALYKIQGQLQISKMNKGYFIAFISPTEPRA